MGLVFKALNENVVKDILSHIESYTDNNRIVLNQFYKYFDEEHITQEKGTIYLTSSDHIR